MLVFSVVEKTLLLNVGLFAQESADACSVLLDVCKLIVTMIVVFRIQASWSLEKVLVVPMHL